MKQTVILAVALIVLCGMITRAEKPGSFQQAMQWSAEQGKPILLEFVHDD